MTMYVLTVGVNVVAVYSDRLVARKRLRQAHCHLYHVSPSDIRLTVRKLDAKKGKYSFLFEG
jgi:hypothetical protein